MAFLEIDIEFNFYALRWFTSKLLKKEKNVFWNKSKYVRNNVWSDERLKMIKHIHFYWFQNEVIEIQIEILL